jgi:hypothetical protein
VKVGFSYEQDLKTLQDARSAAGDQWLAADANQGWTLKQASAFMPVLDDFDLAWIEEPLAADASAADWQALKERAPMLLAAGENVNHLPAFEAALDTWGLGVIQPDLAKWGGFTGCIEVVRLARRHGLPVLLHVRRSADILLRELRRQPVGGIAHAFNGSAQQAHAFVDLGFALGFGGTLTFERALQVRRLACELPLSALVLETDAPDIPPHWLYETAAARAGGHSQGRNEPGELPAIGLALARLRAMAPEALAEATTRNACAVLPRLAPLLGRMSDVADPRHGPETDNRGP